MEKQRASQPLPDVAHEKITSVYTSLDWVGMSGIEVPIQLRGDEGFFRQAARADAHVSLDRSPSRGIHMSRLYLTLQEALPKAELGFGLLKDIVEDFLDSHRELSRSARLRLHFEWPLRRKALVSSYQSWRSYPVSLAAECRNGVWSFSTEVLVTYSSTCPASAALSRRLIQENFRREFGGGEPSFEQVDAWLGSPAGLGATPHAQRSLAKVKIRSEKIMAPELIDLVEEALQTAVQGAVKREDEQEFARRNGQNLMFCEDAARRVQAVLEDRPEIEDYVASFDHVESLHPHSAVSAISKGLPGGWRQD